MIRHIEYISQYCKAKQLSESYQKNLIAYVIECLGWCAENNLKPFKLKTTDLEGYQEYLLNRKSRRGGKLSNSSVNQQINAIQIFYREAQKHGQIKGANPAAILKKPRVDKTIGREILSMDEVKQFFQVCEEKKDNVLLHLVYTAGLRISEAERIDVRDLDFHINQLIVRNGKGNKSRSIPLPKPIMQELKDYVLHQRDSFLKDENCRALLLTKSGIRAKKGAIYKRFLYLKSQTTITKNITPHGMRASLATHMIEKGIEVEYVQAFLGHASLDTSLIYTSQAVI